MVIFVKLGMKGSHPVASLFKSINIQEPTNYIWFHWPNLIGNKNVMLWSFVLKIHLNFLLLLNVVVIKCLALREWCTRNCILRRKQAGMSAHREHDEPAKKEAAHGLAYIQKKG